MFNFTPLLGAQSASTASQSLLELDGGVKVLVDVGWDASFDAAALQALERHVPELSLILLTHATVDHLGAYAHCCKHVPLFSKIPVYATTPVVNLGRTLLTDLYASAPLTTSIIPASAIAGADTTTDAPTLLRPCPTAEEIAGYFNAINPLKYSQPHQPIPSPFSPPLGNLTITAYNAGHTPGGTIWHIQHSMESIVYAVDWNQGRENLLAGAAWLGGAGAEIIEPLRRPTALVCSAKGVEKTDGLPRRKRDELLVTMVRDTIVQGGKVLIPTDSSARVLELAFILNHTWRENTTGPHADTYRRARVYMASRSSTQTIRQLPSMLEWMDEVIIRDAEAVMSKDKGDEKVSSLLDWKFVKQIERKSQLERALRRSHPSVILASDASLEWGFSRHALQSLAADPRNLVILTEATSEGGDGEGSLARQLSRTFLELVEQGGSGARLVSTSGQQVSLRNAAAESLSPEEDLLHQQYMARQRQLFANQGDSGAVDNTVTEIADDQASDDSESEDENDDESQQGRALNASAQMTQSNKRKAGLTEAELGINILLRSKTVHDFDVRGRRGREKIFPFVAHRHKADEFGDVIKPEDYLRAEERDDVDGQDMKAGGPAAAAPGQKRKWDDAGAKNTRAARSAEENVTKRTKVEREPDDIDALIARATGEAGGANGAASESDDGSESDYEPDEASADTPRKVVITTTSLTLYLRLAHVDFTALHEKRDLQMLIPMIAPRKLILVAGAASETATLADECRRLLADAATAVDIFTPSVAETVDASVDTNAWTIKLSRALVRRLTWQNVKGLGIVALTGRLDVEPLDTSSTEDESAAKKQKLLPPTTTETSLVVASSPLPSIPLLDIPSSSLSSASSALTHTRGTQPVHVGDLRLADLRRLMLSSGHTAEFRGEGTLLVDSTVVVRKGAAGRIEVEAGAGGLAPPVYRTKDMQGSFFAVRRAIYEGLAVVAGI